MGERIRAFDWSSHPLGPPERWPQSLRTMVEVMLDSRYAMWLGWGREYHFFYNDAYAAMTLGPKHPWALGRTASEVWAEIWHEIGRRARRVMETGTATWDEGLLLFLERSGFPEETYHTFSYSPIPDDRGGVGGMLCVVTEDTERRIGERRLRTLRELAARTNDNAVSVEQACATAISILDANPADVPFALLYLADSSGRVATLAGSCGFPGDATAAPRCVSLDDDNGVWPFRAAAGAGRAVDADDAIARIGPISGRPWPEPIQRGLVLPLAKPGLSTVAGFLVAGASARRPLDDAYRGFFDLLAGQIATAIANARAYEEERRRATALAELDRAKTNFFSNVSHEFRTPLTLMLAPVEDLLSSAGELPEHHQQALNLVHRNSLRLLKLVNTLLDFSRIEAGRAQARFVCSDVSALTADLVSVFRSAIERAGLKLVVDCPDIDSPIFLDQDMWEKIVLNLLSNALKFTFEGEIGVSLREREQSVELVVRDTGVGIAPANLPRIFERFHRVEGVRSRTHEGTGIGLALVHELVRLHGGTISVESAEGSGTAFTVAIPKGSAHLPPEHIVETPPNAGARSAAPRLYAEEALRWLPGHSADDDTPLLFGDEESGAGPQAGVSRPRILLADDNADMRHYVTRLLGGRFEVEAVSDGEAALAAARANPPDLILSDVMMPTLDGFGLLRAIRDDEALRRTPFVMLSARAGEEARVEGLDAGADDYLTKPFSGRELIARISGNLELASVRRRAEMRERELRTEAETLNDVARMLGAELDLERLVQVVTDAGTRLTNAAFGAFFYNRTSDDGESYVLYTLSGVPRESFESFPMPRNTSLFGPTFRGEGPIRIHDVTKDPRFGKNAPYYGMPKGHLPVRSYLAVPVLTRHGEVLGGLFFGHPEPGVFTERAERLLLGLAAQAAIAMDNARLYGRAQREIAERTRAEEALRRRTIQYETLVNHAPLGVYMVDADFKVRECNPIAAEVLCPEGDPLGRDFAELAAQNWVPERAEGAVRQFQHTLETGEGYYEAEHVEQRRDGRKSGYFEWRIDRIPTPDGRHGVVCYFRDISETVLARQAISQAARQQSAVARLGEIALQERNLQKLLDCAVSTLAETLGVEFVKVIELLPGGEEFVLRAGVGWNEGLVGAVRIGAGPDSHGGYTLSADAPVVVNDMAQERRFRGTQLLLDHGVVSGMSCVIRRTDGNAWGVLGTHSRRQVRFTPDDVSFLVAVANILGDAIHRDAADRALRDSEVRYRAIVESQTEMVCRFRADGEILFANRAYAHARGTTPEALTGANLWQFIHESDRAGVRALLDSLTPDNRQVKIENRFETEHGTRWTLWTNHGLAFDADGRATEIQSVGIDITDRKLAEQALHEREKSERQARAEAEKANRLKDEFLATLSHELRTPLNAILGWSRLIDRNAGDLATVQQGIEVITRNAKVQADLIADLLDMSRIVSGKLRLEIDAVCLADVVNAAIDAVRHAAEAKGVRIQPVLYPIADPVRGDASRLQQVLWNILSNAVKFTPRGGQVDVFVAKKNSFAEIVVRDTGIGIPPEFLPHIFERFRQADASTARQFGGLGLGLSIVKNLVELHGGTVSVHSPGEGQGTTFTIQLPLAITRAPVDPEPPPTRLDMGDFDLRGVKVLAIDDQLDARELVRRVLEDHAAHVLTAASADEGLRLVETLRPDVVLCDIGMPDKDGYQFVRELRDRGVDTPAVAVTAFARSEDRLRALRAGYQGHVVKPVEPAELVATVAVFAKPPLARRVAENGEGGRIGVAKD
jgi:PAS domain S-box-containing protein